MHRPDDADGRILADAPPAPGPLDAQRRKHGEDHRPGYGVGSRVESYAQPAERGVRDAAREENHPPAYDVGAYDAARYAREDTCRQRIGQVAVLDQIAEKFHPRSLYLPLHPCKPNVVRNANPVMPRNKDVRINVKM